MYTTFHEPVVWREEGGQQWRDFGGTTLLFRNFSKVSNRNQKIGLA
jgi:hypothetical protein